MRLLLLVAFLCCLASSCTSGPERVVKQSIKALQKGDYEAYASTFNISSSDQKYYALMAEDKLSEKIEYNEGIKSFKIIDTQIDDDIATVTVIIFYNDDSEEEQTIDLVKVDGEWKQELD